MRFLGLCQIVAYIGYYLSFYVLIRQVNSRIAGVTNIIKKDTGCGMVNSQDNIDSIPKSTL